MKRDQLKVASKMGCFVPLIQNLFSCTFQPFFRHRIWSWTLWLKVLQSMASRWELGSQDYEHLALSGLTVTGGMRQKRFFSKAGARKTVLQCLCGSKWETGKFLPLYQSAWHCPQTHFILCSLKKLCFIKTIWQRNQQGREKTVLFSRHFAFQAWPFSYWSNVPCLWN